MAEWHCYCGRRWHLEWFRLRDGSMAGPSWILESLKVASAYPLPGGSSWP